MSNAPIFVITGPPAAGKSAISNALLKRFAFGLHIPVDDLREWVVAGIAHPMGWNEETTRQFRLAEEAAADLAVRYNDAGFAVAIDHCQGPPRLDELVSERFEGRLVFKLAIAPTLDENLERNRLRPNKAFDTQILTPSIKQLNPLYRSEPIELTGWMLVDNTAQSIGQTVDAILDRCGMSRAD